jgi:hypothetical protein
MPSGLPTHKPLPGKVLPTGRPREGDPNRMVPNTAVPGNGVAPKTTPSRHGFPTRNPQPSNDKVSNGDYGGNSRQGGRT